MAGALERSGDEGVGPLGKAMPVDASGEDPATSAKLKDGAAWGLYITETCKGRGVLAGTAIPKGALVLRFEGPIYDRDTCPEFSEAIQVGENAWMWSSGGLDDLVNHSCDPNTGILQVADRIYLLAIKDIRQDEELSFDYSTSMVDEPWELTRCLCGSDKCRGYAGNFLDMPLDAMQYYAKQGVLPKHVSAAAAARGIALTSHSVVPGNAPS